MARIRNYKAEYAAQKQRATNAGYSSVKEYKVTRKTLGLGRARASNIPKRIAKVIISTDRIRKENAQWSAEHSRVPNSKWNPNFNDDRARRYWIAFTDEEMVEDAEKKRRLKDYLVYYGLVTEEEWKSDYLGKQ